MEFHPIANLFPLMEGVALNELANDIAANGLMEPILLYNSKIVDGRNRFRACQMAGIEPAFESWTGDESALLTHVMSRNVHRRHLSAAQRALIILEAHDLVASIQEESRQRIREGQVRGGFISQGMVPPEPVDTLRQNRTTAARLGAMVGISGGTVNRVSRVLKELPPEDAEALRRGEKTLGEVGRKLPARGRFKTKTKPSLTEQIVTDMNAAYAELRPHMPQMPQRTAFEELLSRLVDRALKLQVYQTSKQLQSRQENHASYQRRSKRGARSNDPT